MVIQTAEANPVAGKGSVGLVVETKEAGVLEFVRAGFCPTGSLGIDEQFLTHDFRVRAVAAVHTYTAPVAELVASPDGGDSHEVMVVGEPCITLGYAIGPFVQANGYGLVGDVVWSDLEGVVHVGSEVHLQVWAIECPRYWSRAGKSFFFDAPEVSGVHILVL